MKYRDILGFSKSKKKVVKEQPKPKKTVLDGIKKDLLKESYVWERKFGEKLPTLASIQKKKLNEVGAGAQYRKFYKDIERQQKGLSKSVNKFKQYLEVQGLKSKARELEDHYLIDSYGWMRKWLKKFIEDLM